MRALFLLPIALAATPVAAQERSSDAEIARGAERAASVLEDPRNADAIADAVGGMTEAMMQLPVGGLIEAMRRANPRAAQDLPRVDRNATIAEITGSDPTLPGRVAEGTRTGSVVAGAAMREMARMAPVLIAMGRDMAAQMEARIATVRSQRGE